MTLKKMLESRPKDALGSLVETVETVEAVKTVESVETVETRGFQFFAPSPSIHCFLENYLISLETPEDS